MTTTRKVLRYAGAGTLPPCVFLLIFFSFFLQENRTQSLSYKSYLSIDEREP